MKKKIEKKLLSCTSWYLMVFACMIWYNEKKGIFFSHFWSFKFTKNMGKKMIHNGSVVMVRWMDHTSCWYRCKKIERNYTFHRISTFVFVVNRNNFFRWISKLLLEQIQTICTITATVFLIKKYLFHMFEVGHDHHYFHQRLIH